MEAGLKKNSVKEKLPTPFEWFAGLLIKNTAQIRVK